MSGEIKKESFKEALFRKPFLKRMILMLIGVEIMGICVALLNMTNFGVDPFTAVSYGLKDLLGIELLGTVNLMFNGTLLLIVLCFDVNRLGFGTAGNMILIGYTADLTNYCLKLMGITSLDGMATRIIVMLIALAIFVFAVALYVNAGLGASAYDALPYIIHEKFIKKKCSFKYVRIAFDAFFTILAFIIKGQAGVITVLMVISLGPIIEVVSKLVAKLLKLENN